MCGERYLDDPTNTPQTDVNAKIWNATTGDLVIDHTESAATTNLRITSLALAEGEQYRAQLRYRNADGWGPWSNNIIARVPKDLGFAPLNVPEEPVDGGTCPSLPVNQVPIQPERRLLDLAFETGHILRRPRDTKDRRTEQVEWLLSSTDADALITFLQARMNAGESFTFDESEYFEGAAWFVDKGTIERTMAGPNRDRLACRIIEVVRSRAFTIAKSSIGGPDRIRGSLA